MTRQHIHLLDGIRGYAAFAVVLTHMMTFFHHKLPVEAGILAVDLFFVMSGLVLARSYEGKLRDGRLSFAGFLEKRLLRLYPLYLLGGLAGGLVLLARQMVGDGEVPVLGMISALVSMLLMLPQVVAPITVGPFPFNGPAWSLSFELYGNLFFALIAPRLSNRRLAVSVAICFVIFAAASVSYGELNLGPRYSDFWVGIPRFWFSFGAGVLLWRLRERLPRLGVWALPLFLLGMAFPALPAGVGLRLFWVGVMMPLAVAAACQISVEGRGAKLCDVLGRLSYPLYITHMPVKILLVIVAGKMMGPRAWGSPLVGLVILAVMLGVAVLTTWWIEPRLRATAGAWVARWHARKTLNSDR